MDFHAFTLKRGIFSSLVLFALWSPQVHAQPAWWEEVGYNALVLELGGGLPTGMNFGGVTQVEGQDGSGRYRPDTTNSQFAGKTFSFPSGGNTGVSGHANAIGENFYGSTTSLLSDIGNITSYEVNDWLGAGFLKTGQTGLGAAPSVETNRVQNHSWAATFGSDATDLNAIRRFDFMINRDKVVAVVGVNNDNSLPGGGTDRNLMSTAYNSISVGRSNGAHMSGETALDGEGRFRPHIVAPATSTSQATARVSSAAAFILSAIDQADGPLDTADDHRVVKAILMAGATKEESMNWSRTTTSPLDDHYGAGQLNVYNSYHILTAGQQPAAGNIILDERGWDFSNVSTGTGTRLYFVEADNTFDISIMLTWDRIVSANSDWTSITSSLANLDLRLWTVDEDFNLLSLVDSSLSTIENLEHIWHTQLAAGRYAIEVSSADATSTEFGIAWDMAVIPEPSTYVLLGLGLGVLVWLRRNPKKLV